MRLVLAGGWGEILSWLFRLSGNPERPIAFGASNFAMDSPRPFLFSWASGAGTAAGRAGLEQAGGKEEDGRHASIDRLFRKYGASLYWVCLRYTRDGQDAEDMVQQVFLKVHRNLGAFRGESGIYTWLYRIAINECISMLRKRKVEAADPSEFIDNPSFSPEGQMEARLVLEKITGSSDAKTMEILFLLYLEGLKQEEVAGLLNISRSTVNRKVAAFKARMERFS